MRRNPLVPYTTRSRQKAGGHRSTKRKTRDGKRIRMIAKKIPKDLLQYLSHADLADWLTSHELPTTRRTMSRVMKRATEEGSLLWRGKQAAIALPASETAQQPTQAALDLPTPDTTEADEQAKETGADRDRPASVKVDYRK